MKFRKLVAAPAAIVLGLGVVLVAPALSASAHSATVSSKAACTTATGAGVVTWTLDNDYALVMTVTKSDDTAIPVGTTVPATSGHGDTSITLTESIAAPAAGKSVTAHLQFKWSDGFTQPDTSKNVNAVETDVSQKVSSDCKVPIPKDASASLSVTPATCTSGAVLTYSGQNGTFTGTASGTKGAADYNVTFKANPGHDLVAGQLTHWNGHLDGALAANAPNCIQTETGTPTFTDQVCSGNPNYSITGDDTLVLPAVKGGQWSINGDATDAGTYTYAPGTGVSVSLADADSNDGYSVASGSWSHTFADLSGSCVPPKDATADVTITAPVCAVPLNPGSAVVSDLANATLVGTLDESVGTHTATFLATPGHQFADGTTQFSKDYTIAPAKTISECYPGIKCVTAGGFEGPEAGDVAPTPVIGGDEYDGPHTPAMDNYQRVSAGNAQGLTGMTYTVSNVGGYTARVVVEITAPSLAAVTTNHGTFTTLSTASEAVNGVNDVQDGLWYASKLPYAAQGGQGNPVTWDQLVAMFPDNHLASAPSLHQQSQTPDNTSTTLVKSISSSCGSTTFGLISATPVAPIITEPSCTSQGGVVIPEQSVGIISTTSEDGTSVTFSAADGYYIPEGVQTVYSLVLTPADCTITTQPDSPTATDKCGVGNDTLTVPADTEDYAYTVTPADVAGSKAGTVEVTVAPKADGVSFGEGVTTSWSFDFTNNKCPVTVVLNHKLAFTGISVGQGLIGALALILLGGVALSIRAFRRREAREQ